MKILIVGDSGRGKTTIHQILHPHLAKVMTIRSYEEINRYLKSLKKS